MNKQLGVICIEVAIDIDVNICMHLKGPDAVPVCLVCTSEFCDSLWVKHSIISLSFQNVEMQCSIVPNVQHIMFAQYVMGTLW